jgi:hypothetical protein
MYREARRQLEPGCRRLIDSIQNLDTAMNVPGDLITDHLNGELSADGFVGLDNWLRQRESHAREFVVQWLIHSSLYELLSQRNFQAEALFRAVTTSVNEPYATLSGDRHRSTQRSESTTDGYDHADFSESIAGRGWNWRYAIAGLAAMLVIGLVAGTSVFLAARPRVVAVLSQSVDSQWDLADQRLFDGAQLKTGDVLRLTKGRAMVTFFSGARTVLDAPATFTIQSDMLATLSSGAATTKVPTQAVGFTINMPRGYLVDLGTEFTLRIRPDSSFDVQVFEGLVEMHLIDENGSVDDAPLRISKGVAVRIDAASREVESIPYDAGQKMTMP